MMCLNILEGARPWKGPRRRLGKMSLSEVIEDLELVSVEVTGDHHVLASNDNDLLSVEDLLSDNRGKSTEKMTGAIDDLDCVKSVGHVDLEPVTSSVRQSKSDSKMG